LQFSRKKFKKPLAFFRELCYNTFCAQRFTA
jgi:hypothetical protein